MVRYAVIYRCIAGGAVLFHKYFCCWIIDRILSAGSVRFHSLSMEWKIWCELRLTLKLFRLLLWFFILFYFNCQGISQHLFQCAIRGISYSCFFIVEHLSLMSSHSCQQSWDCLELWTWWLRTLFGESAGTVCGFKWFECLAKLCIIYRGQSCLSTSRAGISLNVVLFLRTIVCRVSKLLRFPPLQRSWQRLIDFSEMCH